jgi:hypothetical protein
VGGYDPPSDPTGDTKIGLGPWYTYGDYLTFIGSLPAHPHLKKEIIGKSDGGREHWELTITDPSVPAEKKRRILWHAREHAYETFSSFAIEGVIGYLLSPAGAEARQRYVFTLQPMVNIDGVALGYEYRGNYDFPDARENRHGPADLRRGRPHPSRLRPRLAQLDRAARHQRRLLHRFRRWQPSRRAWDILTQYLPSPRATGHRWDEETVALKHNWFERKVSESNVHGLREASLRDACLGMGDAVVGPR